MRLVQSYATYSAEYPAEPALPCVVEDDDGFRILLLGEGVTEPYVFTKATELGVVMHVFVEAKVAKTPTGTMTYEGEVPGFLEVSSSLTPEAPAYPFVHLHTHSEFSSLDGFSTIDEIVALAKADQQPALAITDHGTCAAHPHLQAAAEKEGIKPIFGLEAYFVDDRHRRPIKRDKDMTPEQIEAVKADQAEVRDYWHLTLYAMNDTGLRNLWAMSTEANREGFYGKPRLDWDTLDRLGEGIICSTACLRGPVSQAILADDIDLAAARLSRLHGIFGDRLYAEIHTNSLPEQIKVNDEMIRLTAPMNIPCIAVVDSHYSCPEHREAHQVWIAAQTGSNINDDAGLFEGAEDYHFMTGEEVYLNLKYLRIDLVKIMMDNTVALADRCTARIAGDPTPPRYGASHEADFDQLFKLCSSSWASKCTGNERTEQEYADRYVREMNLLVSKNLCGYFLIVSDYCQWAKRQGILVGPGRGSGGASLVAYLCGITEVDPVDAELPFERFLTPGRTELPDFDIDFPSERLDEVMNYVSNRWGEKSVVRVGTHIRLKSKGVVKNLAMVMKGTIDMDWDDQVAISDIVTNAEKNTAGLGLTWEELWDIHGDELAPYRAKYPKIFELADIMVGRLKSYGKHAAGVVISNGENLTDLLPLRRGEDDEQLVAEFDMNALAEIGLVKFDFLGLRNLDTIQRCIDLVEANTGQRISPYAWKAEYQDSVVWDFISGGNTLGCFQIETPAGTRVTKAVQPHSLHDLADVITLDRPGPMRSGLDKLYLDRRFGRSQVSYADPRLESVLHRTFGVMLYQEDIMGICRELAGYDEEQADYVRKILGKKKVEAAQEEGRKFIPACVERGMKQEDVEVIWKQMEEFSRYSFNKAHAYGYGVLSYWCAWLSFYYPVEFYTAALSTVDAKRVPDFVVGVKGRGCSVLPPDINDSGEGFSAVGNVIRFGLDAIKGVGESAVRKIVECQPFTSLEQFMELKPANIGIAKLLVRAGAFDSLSDNRKQLEGFLAQYESGDTERCVDYNAHKVGAPNNLPCEFDWSSRPPNIGKRGKEIQQKPIPKGCTVRCPFYRKRTSLTAVDVEPYTPEEIREIETELFGIYLTSSPFDVIPEDVRAELLTAAGLEDTVVGSLVTTAALVKNINPTKDRNQKSMAFLDLFMGDGTVRAVCFQKQWETAKKYLKPGALVLVQLEKTSRGYTLTQTTPL